MSNMDKLASELKSLIKESDDRKPRAYDADAEVLRVDGDTLWVHIAGGVDETPVKKTINALPGDKVKVHIADGRAWVSGNETAPPTDDRVAFNALASAKKVDEKLIITEKLITAELEAEKAKIGDLEADTAKIHELTADQLHASVAYIDGLTAGHIAADDIIADHAEIGSLDANYAKIDIANVNNAWIENGAIKKASVFDENVFDLSGDHATLSRIDASKINVANLRADNLVVRRINGQPVVGGYTLIDSNSPGYSSKNPKALGWYEFVNAEWVLSTDTTVDETKAYYQKGNETSLYDQAYIDALADNLEQQIDGAIETFTGSVVPTLVNYPYTDWYDTSVTPVKDERAKHIGDIYFVVNTASDQNGYCYRFAFDNTTSSYMWVLIKDSDVTKALADITDLQAFESSTTSWIDETDQGLVTIRTNHTNLEGVVNKTVKESIQLWFTKANTTAPSKPTAEVTSTSTAGNAWRKVVPAYNASYPNYYYCWQYKFVDGTFGWSAVVRDIAMGETQGTARDAKNTADNALPASTFTAFESTTFAELVDEVDEQSSTITNMTTRLGMNADGTGASTDIVAKESALEQTVDGINTRVGKNETKLTGMYATSTTAAGTAAKVGTIVPTVTGTWELTKGTTVTVKFTQANAAASPTLNINGTGNKSIKNYSNGNLTEAEYKWKAGDTFTFTYNGTNWLMQDSTASVRMSSAETRITQNADAIALKASQSDMDSLTGRMTTAESTLTVQAGQIASKVETTDYTGAKVASLINQSADSVKIQANHVEIDGAAIFSAIQSDVEDTAQNAVDNLEIGGRNLLIDTDAPSLTKVAASNNRYWSDAGTGYTGTFETMSGLPISGGKYVARLSVTENTNIAHNLTWYSGAGVGLVRGQQYTMSVWCKKVTGSNIQIKFQYGVNSYLGQFVNLIEDNNWHRYSWTFTANNGDNYYYANTSNTRIYIGGTKSSAANEVLLCGFKLEKGNKVTDWSPAPEDIDNAISGKKSTHTLSTNYSWTYANVITNSAENYNKSDGWTVSSTEGVSVGDTVRLKVNVSDMSNTPVYIIGTVTEVTSGTVLKMASHGVDTTVIDGGKILTNTVGANQITAHSINAQHLSISDTSNLAIINELYPESLNGDALGASKLVVENGWIKKSSATNSYMYFTPSRMPLGFKQNDELYYEFYIKGDVAESTNVKLGVWCYDSSNTVFGSNKVSIPVTTSEAKVSGTIKLTHSGFNNAISYIIGIGDERSKKSQLYVKKIIVRRKNGGELIVDGSITANKIAAGAITIGALPNDITANANMLLDADAPTLAKVNAMSPRYWSHADQESYVTTDIVPIVDSPDVNLKNMYQFICNGTNTADTQRACAFYSTNADTHFLALPIKEEAKYTLSVWARCTDGTGKLYISRSGFTRDTGSSSDILDLTSSWKKYTYSLVGTAKGTLQYFRLWVGARFTANTTGTVELCGMSLVANQSSENAISVAEKTATTYITDIDSKKGITIKPSDKTGNNYLQINSNSIDFFKSNKSVVGLTDSAFRMGLDNSGHSTTKSDGLHIWTGVETTPANEVAFFGATARIGTESGRRLNLGGDNAITLYNSSNEIRFQVKDNWILLGKTTGSRITIGTSTDDPYIFMADANNVQLFKVNSTAATIGKSSGAHINVTSSSAFSSGSPGIDIYSDSSKKIGGIIGHYDGSGASLLLVGPGGINKNSIWMSDVGVIDINSSEGVSINNRLYVDKGVDVFNVYRTVRLTATVDTLRIGVYDPDYGDSGKWVICMDGSSNPRDKIWIPRAGEVTGTSGNPMYVTSAGYVHRNTSSSKRYKKDISIISDEELNPDRLYNVEVKQFVYRDDYLDIEDQRYGKVIPGFIVEELENIYPIAVTYENEEPENWDSRYLIPPMLKLIQNQKNEIDSLTERLDAFERRA